MTTLGNAELLGLDRVIGNFAKGKEADMVLLKADPKTVMGRRVELARSIEEEMFIYMTMGDEALVVETIINGMTAEQQSD